MRCVELFAGAGGMSLGFEQAGFEIVGAFDIWQDALRVYRKNLGHRHFASISKTCCWPPKMCDPCARRL